MTTTAPPAQPRHEGLALSSRVIASIAGRSIKLVQRQPSTFIPSLLMPIVFVIAFSGAFSALVQVVPATNILNWNTPMAALQGAAFAGITVAFGVGRDLETGFFDRMLTSTAPRVTLLAGSLLAAAVRGLLPAAITVAVGAIGGLRFNDPLGFVTLGVACVGTAALAACWGLGLTYRVGGMQAAPIIQFGMFITLFLSSAQVPVEQMNSPVLRTIARYNPMTHLLELSRQGLLRTCRAGVSGPCVDAGGVTWAHTWPGLLVIVLGTTGLGLFAVRGLRRLAS